MATKKQWVEYVKLSEKWLRKLKKWAKTTIPASLDEDDEVAGPGSNPPPPPPPPPGP
jgi:hypothetical protein